MKSSSMPSIFLLLVVSMISLVSATTMTKLRIQELQAPSGPKHADGIIKIPENATDAKSMGFVFFANDIVVPDTGGFNSTKPMGSQTGHCAEAWKGQQLACYFRFKVTGNSDRKGTFMAEALFDLTNFPSADLVITGGSGDFLGMIGSGKTVKPPGFDGTTFIYDFDYSIVTATNSRRPWWWL